MKCDQNIVIPSDSPSFSLSCSFLSLPSFNAGPRVFSPSSGGRDEGPQEWFLPLWDPNNKVTSSSASSKPH